MFLKKRSKNEENIFYFNAILFAIFYLSCRVYSSMFPFMPHREMSGMQFLIPVIILLPALLMTLTGKYYVNKKLEISNKETLSLLVMGLIIGILPILFGSLDPFMQYTGTAVSLIAIITIIVRNIMIFKQTH